MVPAKQTSSRKRADRTTIFCRVVLGLAAVIVAIHPFWVEAGMPKPF